MIAVDAIPFHSIAAFSAGCSRADAERPPTTAAWVWATVVMAARFMAASVAPRTSARVSVDIVGSDRSTGAVGTMDWLLGGDGGPPGQLPPATARPPPDLAQPGHARCSCALPSCSSACLLQRQGRAGCRWPAQDGARPVATESDMCLTPALGCSPSLTPTGVRPFPSGQSRAIVPARGRPRWRQRSRFSGGSSRWAVDCRRCRAWLESLPHLVDLVSHLTMRLPVHAGGSLIDGASTKQKTFPSRSSTQ